MEHKRLLPLFDLKVHRQRVLMCGGGGDAIYGKKNGIVLCDLEMNALDFLQMEDIIERVEICGVENGNGTRNGIRNGIKRNVLKGGNSESYNEDLSKDKKNKNEDKKDKNEDKDDKYEDEDKNQNQSRSKNEDQSKDINEGEDKNQNQNQNRSKNEDQSKDKNEDQSKDKNEDEDKNEGDKNNDRNSNENNKGDMFEIKNIEATNDIKDSIKDKTKDKLNINGKDNVNIIENINIDKTHVKDKLMSKDKIINTVNNFMKWNEKNGAKSNLRGINKNSIEKPKQDNELLSKANGDDKQNNGSKNEQQINCEEQVNKDINDEEMQKIINIDKKEQIKSEMIATEMKNKVIQMEENANKAINEKNNEVNKKLLTATDKKTLENNNNILNSDALIQNSKHSAIKNNGSNSDSDNYNYTSESNSESSNTKEASSTGTISESMGLLSSSLSVDSLLGKNIFNCFTFIAIGLENYYIVKCIDTKLEVMLKKNARLQNFSFDTHLYFTDNNTLFQSDIYLNKKEAVPDTSNYYRTKNTINYNDRQYEFDGEIQAPRYSNTNKELVFYTKHNNNTNVVFIGHKKVVKEVKKITCINENDGIVTVGNCEGCVYVFAQDKHCKKVSVYNLPITGCAYKDGWVYFSSFDGNYGRKKMVVLMEYYYLAMALFVLILAVLYALMRNK